MEKTRNAALLAANLGIVRQSCNRALALCKCAHVLDSAIFEDLVGDVTVTLLSPRASGIAPVDSFDPEKGSKFTSFLGTCAFRAAIDTLEMRTKRIMGTTDGGEGDGGEGEDDGRGGDIPDATPTAEAKMIDAERIVALRAACASLGVEEYLDPDYDHAKYAAANGCSVGAARVRLCRTIDALSEEIKGR